MALLKFPGQPDFTRPFVLLALLLPAPIVQAETYELQAGLSRIVIQVYKGGALKALGHNHIISTRDVSGTISWHKTDLQDTGFELVIPVGSFRVDDPALRKQAGKGFTRDVDDDARKGTRNNMLGTKVLDALRFPRIIVRSKSIKQISASQLHITAELIIHGISQIVTVPVVFERTAGVISVKGNFSLLQSDYGIKPLSAALGTIVVKDRIDIHFTLLAGTRAE